MKIKWEEEMYGALYIFHPPGPLLFKWFEKEGELEVFLRGRPIEQFICLSKDKTKLVEKFVAKFIVELIDVIKQYNKVINKKWEDTHNSYYSGMFKCHRYKIFVSPGGKESRLYFNQICCSLKTQLNAKQQKIHYRNLLFNDLIKLSAMLRD